MKLNFSRKGKGQEAAGLARYSRRRASLAQARAQLSQAVGALTSPLGALEQHLNRRTLLAALAGPEAASGVYAERLREVVSRDRALAAVQPAPQMEPNVAPVVARKLEVVPTVPAELLPVAAQPEAQPSTAEALRPTAPLEASQVAAAKSEGSSAGPEALVFAATEQGSAAAPTEALSAAPAGAALCALAAASFAPPAEALPPAHEERPQVVQHEPIRTRTMARLLAGQGYRQRALAIYDELLQSAVADDSLRAEAQALRARCA